MNKCQYSSDLVGYFSQHTQRVAVEWKKLDMKVEEQIRVESNNFCFVSITRKLHILHIDVKLVWNQEVFVVLILFNEQICRILQLVVEK